MWSAVCIEHGWTTNDSDKRYAVHSQAECPQSMRKFENRDFDRFINYCKRLLDRDYSTFIDEVGERRRMIWRINQDATAAGFDEAYVRRIARDMYVFDSFDLLCLNDLRNLRNVIHNRSIKRRSQLTTVPF